MMDRKVALMTMFADHTPPAKMADPTPRSSSGNSSPQVYKKEMSENIFWTATTAHTQVMFPDPVA